MKHKNILAIFMVFAVAFSMLAVPLSGSALAQDGTDYTTAPSDLATIHSNLSGSGTGTDPYVITNPHELQAVNQDLAANYTLGNDIDASGTSSWNSGSGFEPIGDDTAGFTGVLNGDGYEITGLTIDRSSQTDIGLIGYAGNSATVKNIGVVNSDITGDGNSMVGGLVGSNDGTVSNSYATGSLSSSSDGDPVYLGGLAGQNGEGTIINSYAATSVTGENIRVGGLVSSHFSTTSVIENSYWDTETIGDSPSDVGTGLTTSEMQGSEAETNMDGLDFENTWHTSYNDYPVLSADKVQAAPTYPVDVSVVDSSGNAVESDVTIDGTTQTGSTTSFTLAEGEHTATVSADGYETVEQTVTADSDKTVEISLTETTTDSTDSTDNTDSTDDSNDEDVAATPTPGSDGPVIPYEVTGVIGLLILILLGFAFMGPEDDDIEP